MCGIAGFNFPDGKLIKKMNDAQKHRGPDGEGSYTDDRVSLGHRRLSIIDISEDANQPMFYKDFVIVFNGEIYNFKDIKSELQSKGHIFKTQSDTEVILHAYEEWRYECIKKFNGMWAFSIYDISNSELFISRDRFGIKPLYYYKKKDRFIFASEIGAITQHNLNLSINIQSVNFFFWQKYINGSSTVYNEISKLLPGHSIIINLKENKCKIVKYFDIEKGILKAKKTPLNERVSFIKSCLDDAVYKRLISDVPVGSFLSGGIDSSYISSVIARSHPNFNVFSIGFNEDSFNEIKYAELIAKNIDVKHHTKILDIDEDLIFNVINKLDEPFGDPSLIPTFLLSKMTREKVTVALSGDAGDEVFGGYDTYKAYKIARFIPYFLIRFLRMFTGMIGASDKNLHYSYKFKKFINDFDKDINLRHLNWMSQSNERIRKQLFKENFKKLDYKRYGNDLLSLQLNDFENYLSCDILRKTDTASMLNSLETRVPFLDHRLVPVVLSLPENLKVKIFRTKYLLKEIAKGLIPKKIINRKKIGFSVPLSVWFKRSEKMRSIITNKSFYGHELFDFNFAQQLLKDHINGKNDNSRILWLIFVFNIWYKNSPLNNPGE